MIVEAFKLVAPPGRSMNTTSVMWQRRQKQNSSDRILEAAEFQSLLIINYIDERTARIRSKKFQHLMATQTRYKYLLLGKFEG